MHHLNMGSIAVEVLRETKEDIEIVWITIFGITNISLVDLKILSLFNLIESIQYII